MTDKPLLTLKEVSDFLRIGRTHLYQMRQAGRFAPKVFWLGRKPLVRADELRDWIAAGMPSPRDWHWKGRTDER